MSEQRGSSSEQQQQNEEAMMGARRSVLMRFTFVRHGETQANRDRCVQGHTDIPLCQFGEEQATRAGERLRDVRFTRVYASDLSRASTTCRLIVEKNTCHPPPIVIDTRLRERNFGSVEGLGFEEVLRMAEASGSSWPQYSPPGAETLGDLQARLVAFFKEVCQSIYDTNNNNIKKSKAAEDLQKGTKVGIRPANNHKASKEETPNGTQSRDEMEADMEEENLRNEAKEKEEKKKKDGDDEEEEEEEGEEEEGEHVLVVSHGAALRQLYTHLHRTLGCPLPPNLGPETPSRLTPNTGISQYTVRYSPKTYTLHCLCIHDNQHLQGM